MDLEDLILAVNVIKVFKEWNKCEIILKEIILIERKVIATNRKLKI
jgi:hypothetical protein